MNNLVINELSEKWEKSGINKGDVVWYLAPQDILTIARFFRDGKYDASKIIALTVFSYWTWPNIRIIAKQSIAFRD